MRRPNRNYFITMPRLRLFERKNCPVPTCAGWAIILTSIALLTVIGTVSIVPFLASDAPVNADALIIEGWLPDYCLEHVAKVSKKNPCSRIFVTGGPLESGSYLKEYLNYAVLGAATLRALSVPDSLITPVAAIYSPVDRTYASAMAFKNWLDSTRCPLRSFNLCSQSTHTRRSALLFRRALGKTFTIGAIAIDDPDYHPLFWWRSSKGFRLVIDESIALLYALFFVTLH